jgi:hypothetical protein
MANSERDGSRKKPYERPETKKSVDKPQPLGKAVPDETAEGEGSPGLTIGGGGGHA